MTYNNRNDQILTSLFALLDGETTIITSHQAQANFLHAQHAQQQTHSWQTLDVISWIKWVYRAWQQAIDCGFEQLPLLLNANQQRMLWQRVISEKADYISDIASTAQLASQAWDSSQLWQVDLNRYELSESTQAWLKWAEQYQQSCTPYWQDHTQFLHWLISNLPKNNFLQKKKIIFYGFYQVPPLVQKLQSVLQLLGLEIINYQTPHLVNEKVYQCAFVDKYQEIHAIAAWAKQQDLKKSVAVIVPQLAQDHGLIQKIFSQQNVAYHLTEVGKLTDAPLIYAAITALNLLKPELPTEDCQFLLHSPFLGNYFSELVPRARLALQLHKLSEFSFSSGALWQKSRDCPLWMESLQKLPRVQQKYLSAYEWAEVFAQALSTLGWPGDRKLNDCENSALTQWQDVLCEFAGLDFILTKFSLARALGILRNICQQASLQGVEPTAPSVKIYGLRYSENVAYDAVWYMGMHEHVWPANPMPQPFLPNAMQRELNMPHASSEWEYHAAQEKFRLACQSAPQVIFSYSKTNQGEAQHPSPLLAKIPDISLLDLNIQSNATLWTEASLETLSDALGSKVDLAEGAKGGASMLKDQALCPFRGFARHRLQVEAIQAIKYGLTPRERGIILHRALELFWQKITSHAQLLALSDEILAEQVQEVIQQALVGMSQSHKQWAQNQVIALEQVRLQPLLHKWLALEKQRPPFTVVAVEKRVDACIEQLNISLRIDRIDKIDDQNYYIIDYKLNPASPTEWFVPRMGEPQLPMYGLMSDVPVSGLLFAQLRADNMGFRGVSQSQVDLKGVYPIEHYSQKEGDAWQHQYQIWQETLQTLVREFSQGQAHKQPRDGLATCNRCDLHALCRVHEQV